VAVYRPTYTDQVTGEQKESRVWWYEFTFAGKRVRESSKSTRKTIAQQAEKTRRLELERALVGIPTEARENRINSVSDVVKAYSEHYPSNHRPKSVIASKQRLAHVERLLGKALIPDLTESRIREYIKTRLHEDAGGRTINMELGELSRAVGQKWSVMWPKVRKLEENHDVGKALSPDEEQRLLATAANDQSPNRNRMLCPFLEIALTTGMRSGEIAGLQWGRVDFATDVLTVGKAKTQGGSGRQIPMNEDIRNALALHLAWYREKIGEPRADWFVFPARQGRPQSGRKRPYDPTTPITNIADSWEALRKAANVSCRLHDLRHTAATKMAEAGTPESTMLAIMGHMSRAMLERYSHIRMTAKREAVKAMPLPKVEQKSVGALQEIPKVKHFRLVAGGRK
jgi:integrase